MSGGVRSVIYGGGGYGTIERGREASVSLEHTKIRRISEPGHHHEQ